MRDFGVDQCVVPQCGKSSWNVSLRSGQVLSPVDSVDGFFCESV